MRRPAGAVAAGVAAGHAANVSVSVATAPVAHIRVRVAGPLSAVTHGAAGRRAAAGRLHIAPSCFPAARGVRMTWRAQGAQHVGGAGVCSGPVAASVGGRVSGPGGEHGDTSKQASCPGGGVGRVPAGERAVDERSGGRGGGVCGRRLRRVGVAGGGGARGAGRGCERSRGVHAGRWDGGRRGRRDGEEAAGARRRRRRRPPRPPPRPASPSPRGDRPPPAGGDEARMVAPRSRPGDAQRRPPTGVGRASKQHSKTPAETHPTEADRAGITTPIGPIQDTSIIAADRLTMSLLAGRGNRNVVAGEILMVSANRLTMSLRSNSCRGLCYRLPL